MKRSAVYGQYREASATDLKEAIRSGSISCQTAASMALTAIDAEDVKARAWEFVDAAQAIDQAEKTAEAMRADADAFPLGGLPIGIKDVIDTDDMPTAYGSKAYVGNQPQRSAWIVSALRDAGANIIGKTVTTEFACGAHPVTRNPLAPDRTPGGSSSGSAAAVAAGMVPIAVGTQTTGSLLKPASFCGVYAYKPTLGKFPTDGMAALAPTMDTLGFMARDIRDFRLMLGLLETGSACVDSRWPEDRQIRIGYMRTFEWDILLGSTQDAITNLCKTLLRLGVDVAQVELPDRFRGLGEAQDAILSREIASTLGDYAEANRGICSRKLLAFVERGHSVTDARYADALELAQECRGAFSDLSLSFDALLAPAVVGEGPVGFESTGDSRICRNWTLLGTPCVLIPCMTGPAHLPIGVQLISHHNDDAGLLDVSERVSTLLAEGI